MSRQHAIPVCFNLCNIIWFEWAPVLISVCLSLEHFLLCACLCLSGCHFLLLWFQLARSHSTCATMYTCKCVHIKCALTSFLYSFVRYNHVECFGLSVISHLNISEQQNNDNQAIEEDTSLYILYLCIYILYIMYISIYKYIERYIFLSI